MRKGSIDTLADSISYREMQTSRRSVRTVSEEASNSSRVISQSNRLTWRVKCCTKLWRSTLSLMADQLQVLLTTDNLLMKSLLTIRQWWKLTETWSSWHFGLPVVSSFQSCLTLLLDTRQFQEIQLTPNALSVNIPQSMPLSTKILRWKSRPSSYDGGKC